MPRIDRRQFLEHSMLAATGAAALGVPRTLAAAPKQSKSPNERLSLAVIGVGWRGGTHVKEFAKRDDCVVSTICDADEEIGMNMVETAAKQQGHRPKFVRDMRHIFDDPSIDAVSIAAPNHWHALAAIWAMQAGKDVYVEKPVSHTVREGRLIVQAARKYKKICQTGTQWRSYGATMAANQFMHEGHLGEVRLARCLVFKRREPIGVPKEYPVPSSVDYDLWTGPAPMCPVMRPKFHYDWHWFWDYGNGELANSGVHRVDLARLGMGLTGFGRAVMSYGGRLGYKPGEDGGQTPNTQVVVHDFGEKTIVQEIRGLETEPYMDCENGILFYGTEGTIVLKRGKAALFDPQGQLVKPLVGPDENHFGNFIEAVHSRKPGDLNAEILEGHTSSALAHVANISHRLGREASPDDILGQLAARPLHDDVRQTWQRVESHLADNRLDPTKTPLTLGPWLRIDSDQERFVDEPAADAMLTHPYRAPFVVPEENEL